ncbi:hypothetical protein JA9_004484 [Meyerozyma sp. JA9]|nr:hypothetical protein JA9_004484 [Meyerozyma sp. JA9]
MQIGDLDMYRLLCCGSNGSGQLGIGTTDDVDVVEEALFETETGRSGIIVTRPIQVACGGNHTVVLMDNGDVYGAGDNSSNQCGLEEEREYIFFTKINVEKCKFVSCGWEFTVFVTRNGDIYTCGRGSKGELGRGSASVSSLSKIAHIPGIVELQSSHTHTVLRTSNNELYGWGTCRRGELGAVEGAKYLCEPSKLDFPIKNLKYYALGRNRTIFCHDKITMNLDKEDVFSETGGSLASTVVALRAMWTSVHVSTGDQIISIGNNSHGQLCSQQIPFTAMETGSEHGLLVTTDNRVLAWGWGEHGNCGHTDDDSVVYNMNCIYKGQPLMVAGGCATSWVVVTA